MNSQFLLEKLEDSEEYKKFMKENKDAYLCSAFFIIDLQNHQPVLASSCNPTEVEYFSDSENKFHFDYYLPSSKKTFSFEYENGIKLVPLERYDEKVLEKLSEKQHFDFDELYDKVKGKMEEEKISNKIIKMIFSWQNFEGKDTLFGTIMLSGLALLKMTFDISEDKIVEFEKKSFFDMMKIVKK
jgi:hypothetical protein